MSITCALVRQRDLFSTGRYPWGDSALNTLLVMRAEHFQQLEGNYSRVGFQHPGPFLLYVLAAGEALFRNVLHVVPTPYNGQLVGVTVYVAVFVALTMVSLYRMTRSLGVTAIAFGAVFTFAAQHGLFGQDWFPVLYMSAFLLFVVAGAGVAAGVTTELPLYVLGANVLVHGHVSFLLFVAVTTAAVGAGWWLRHRHAIRAELAAHRTGLIAAGVVQFAFLLPMILDVALHFPGQWRRYWIYALHGERTPRSMSQVVDFVGHYWSSVGVPSVLFVVAGVVAVLLTGSERDLGRRRVFLAVYGMIALQTLLVGYYVLRGVDQLTPLRQYGYVGYFYETVPLVLLVAAGGQLWMRVRELSAGRLPARVNAFVPRAAAIAICAALVATGATAAQLAHAGSRPANTSYTAIVAALRSNPDRAGRPIGMVQDESSIWPIASGVGAQLQRAGVPWCLDRATPNLTVLYTPAYVCHSSGRQWVVQVRVTPPPAGCDVVWSGWVGDRGRGARTWVYTH